MTAIVSKVKSLNGNGAASRAAVNEGMEYDFSINQNPDIRVVYIGNERQAVIIVDNFMNKPECMLAYAEYGSEFKPEASDFYPGIKKSAPRSYAEDLAETSYYTLGKVFKLSSSAGPKICVSSLSITTIEPEKLLPIQSIPHFDHSDSNQFAVLHYLCQAPHGGTSFYRHRQTGYEIVSEERLKNYTKTLEREATTVGLPKAEYINGDSALFERIASFDAKFNRALIYHSNVLHSGNIQAQSGLSSDPRLGRLTATTSLIFR